MHLTPTCVAFAAEGGIVPAVSIVKGLLSNGSSGRVLVFYGSHDSEHPEPVEELLALKDRHLGRLSLCFVTNREPHEAELLTGRLDAAKVNAFATRFFDPRSVREYFVCGTQALIDEVTGALESVGVEPGRIRSTNSSGASATPASIVPAAPAKAHETRVDLVMDGRRRSFSMVTGEETILDAATRAGIDLPFSCRAGVCSTCRTKLVRGEVDLAQNYALEDWELEQGFILACQAHAKTPEIELTYDEK